MDRVRLENLGFSLLIVLLLLYPFIYIGHYAGDAIIHLSFGENAAQGHFFEFNSGEKSSGESSVGYMLWVGALFYLLPKALVPIAVKITNYLAWISILFLFYLILKLKELNKYTIAVALFALGLIPGSVYNSMNGMENVLFALFILLWFYSAIRCDYFKLDLPLSSRTLSLEIILSFILGIGTWLRLEALPFFLIVIGTRLLAAWYYKQSISALSKRTVAGVVFFLLPLFSLLFFIHRETGDWIQSSVIARTLLGGIESHHVGLFLFDPKMLIRLACYFPITFFWILGVICFFQNNWKEKVDELFAIALFISVIVMFTFVSGVFQLSRYMIFLTPFWVLIAARGMEYLRVVSKSRLYLYSMSLTIFALAAAYSVETKQRYSLGNASDFVTTIYAPKMRQQRSDELYTALGQPKPPIIIAGGEVDERYLFDNRFIIRCLDGRIDPALLKYFHKDSIDYLSYLKERQVNYFMLDYSIPSFQNSLAEEKLKKLKIGESLELKNVRITFVGTKYAVYKIDDT